MGEARPTLLTIGHSAHDLDAFLRLLVKHAVTAIADVRSQPYSRMYPQFNRETLAAALRSAGVQYVYLGKELGARRDERAAYRDGQARYELIRPLPAFREGLERVRRGLASHRIALLCAEKDPLTCHRAILVCRELRGELEISHIREDGSLESTAQLELRLLDAVGLAPENLFCTRAELIEQAYDLHAVRIAYTESESDAVASEEAP